MRSARLWMIAACVISAGSLYAVSAASRKPGLWELTTVTTWQKESSIDGPESGKLRGGTHKKLMCLTEEMIDQYGALLPQAHGQCKIENRVVTPGKVTGDYVCTGMMSGQGVVDSVWTDDEHAHGTLHFIGTMLAGRGPEPIEWTTTSSWVFKGSDCGNIKPAPLPKR